MDREAARRRARLPLIALGLLSVVHLGVYTAEHGAAAGESARGFAGLPVYLWALWSIHRGRAIGWFYVGSFMRFLSVLAVPTFVIHVLPDPSAADVVGLVVIVANLIVLNLPPVRALYSTAEAAERPRSPSTRRRADGALRANEPRGDRTRSRSMHRASVSPVAGHPVVGHIDASSLGGATTHLPVDAEVDAHRRGAATEPAHPLVLFGSRHLVRSEGPGASA